jgi:peroxiredoxin Q/BCP
MRAAATDLAMNPSVARSLEPGDKAPSFDLPGADGQTVSLASLLEKGPVVVFFYPKDETPGCTAEACSFRDAWDGFKKLGASVVGISRDSAASHASFRDHHQLPYLLLSDRDGAVRKAFGVPKTLGLLDGRSTYVIDKSGVVKKAFHSQLRATRHVDEALEALKTLS